MSLRLLLVCTFLLFDAGFTPGLYSFSLPSQTAHEIDLFFSSNQEERSLRDFLSSTDRTVLRPLYGKRNFLPYWVDDQGISTGGLQLIDILRDAPLEGLCSDDYQLSRIESLALLESDWRREGVLYDPQHIAALDILMTGAFLDYTSDLAGGRVDPLGTRVNWYAKGVDIDPGGLLDKVAAGVTLADIVSSIAPLEQGYVRLKEALSLYRSIASEGGWPIILDGSELKRDERNDRIPLIRKRLKISGDISIDTVAEDDFYDSDLEQGVKRFQSRHGLNPDGVLGRKTIEALNVPVENRIRQIELNMERWRWLPRSLGNRYLVVNIADFSLEVVEVGEAVVSMPVIVGKLYRKTPVFSALMTYLEFAPYWTVPPTILAEDKLPVIKKNPLWLEDQHYEIIDGGGQKVDPLSVDWGGVSAETFPGILRQQPGPSNALGGVKFMFPNPFSVYLHDTPERYLFKRDIRSFSSGCIRIERPLDLVRYLLRDDSMWDNEKILEHYRGIVPKIVVLKKPLPVYILYWTTWVDRAGELQFREDLYLRDESLDRVLLSESTDSEYVLEPAEGNKGADAGAE